MDNAFSRFTYLLLRVVSGLLIAQAGAKIVFGWFGGMRAPDGSTPPLFSQAGLGGGIELACGLLVMLGLWTRPAAFLLSGTMAVAYWQFHAPHGTWPIENDGMPAVLLSFIFLFVAAAGGGNLSVDARLRRKQAPA